jgi:hypothetical protein
MDGTELLNIKQAFESIWNNMGSLQYVQIYADSTCKTNMMDWKLHSHNLLPAEKVEEGLPRLPEWFHR